jgi:membrane protease YdiL (CAAX protease family)
MSSLCGVQAELNLDFCSYKNSAANNGVAFKGPYEYCEIIIFASFLAPLPEELVFLGIWVGIKNQITCNRFRGLCIG